MCQTKRDGRDIRAFTPVFDGLCPAMTKKVQRMPQKLLPTSLVGSYPQPDWLIDRAKLSKMVPRVKMDDLWLVPPSDLEKKQDEATD